MPTPPRADRPSTSTPPRQAAAGALSVRRVGWAGAAALAAAMGIGRFAFTPLLPLMQAETRVGLGAGALLAAANYLGYLLGALACLRGPQHPLTAARIGLAGVVVATAATGAAMPFEAALLVRIIAGAASAWVLVGVSAWALPVLAAAGRSDRAGWVYAGVGAGIAGAGFIAWAAAVQRWPTPAVWIALAVVAAAAALPTWMAVARSADAAAGGGAGPQRRTDAAPSRVGRLVACYGALGFGYIVPATFLPSAARAAGADPAVYGALWPLFGLAAAASTPLAGRLLQRHRPRAVWSGAMALMGLGVAVQLAAPTAVAAFVCSAFAVGGSFMAATMAGLIEARRHTTDPRSAARLIAAMTAAFATGQLLGPLVVAGAVRLGHDPFTLAGALAVAALWAAAGTLARRAHPAPTASR
ncbi:MAG: YbfB/YjiJ family MFS transporter [Rubrivivax sp.]